MVEQERGTWVRVGTEKTPSQCAKTGSNLHYYFRSKLWTTGSVTHRRGVLELRVNNAVLKRMGRSALPTQKIFIKRQKNKVSIIGVGYPNSD